MYEGDREGAPFVSPSTSKKPLHISHTSNRQPNSSSVSRFTMNNSDDKNEQEYNHDDINNGNRRRMKVNKEEEAAQKRSPNIMDVTAITNNDSSISKRSPSFDDLQHLLYKGDDNNSLPRIRDFNSNSNSSDNLPRPSAMTESYDSIHGEGKEGGICNILDPLESEGDMLLRRHHTAPASIGYRNDPNQYHASIRPLSHHYHHRHYDNSSVSSSSGSSISSVSLLPLSSMTLGTPDKACPDCHKTFSRSRDRARHMNSVHKAYKMNKCTACGCFFTRMDSLLRHQRNKTCNNVNARSSPSSPTPLFRKGAVYGTTMALPSPP